MTRTSILSTPSRYLNQELQQRLCSYLLQKNILYISQSILQQLMNNMVKKTCNDLKLHIRIYSGNVYSWNHIQVTSEKKFILHALQLKTTC